MEAFQAGSRFSCLHTGIPAAPDIAQGSASASHCGRRRTSSIANARPPWHFSNIAGLRKFSGFQFHFDLKYSFHFISFHLTVFYFILFYLTVFYFILFEIKSNDLGLRITR
jgi:hypothetical protein